MPEDILEAAQKVINDAAGITKEPGKPAAPTDAVAVPVDATLPPAEPAPEPLSTPAPAMEVKSAADNQMPQTQPTPESPAVSKPPEPVMPTPEAPPKPTEDQNKTAVDSVIVPSSTADMPMADASQLVESILTPKNPDAVVPPAGAPPKHNAAPLPKRSGPGIIIAMIALLLLALPVGVYFVSQQNKQLADIRSKATGNIYGYGCRRDNPFSCGGNPSQCHCQDGNACTVMACDPEIEGQCHDQGRSYCANQGGAANTCCAVGYTCCSGYDGCCPGGGPTVPPGTNHPTQPPGNDTPTPTSPAIHECTNLKIYKDGVQVTPSTLRPDDNIVFAVKGSGSPNKARFRVNGAAWAESTTTNASAEYTQAYTVPVGVTDFVIEAEVFVDGVWK